MCGCNPTTQTTCTDCCNNTDPCVTQPCGCEVELNAACVRYTGEALPCADIATGDTVETALQAIAEKLCQFSGSYVTVTVEAAGANCANGGIQVDIFDSESDTLLSSSFVCNGVDGADGNTIDVVAEVAGVNCTNGGVAVNIYDNLGALVSTEYVCIPDCNCPPPVAKENFYVEAISDIKLSSDPAFTNMTYFQPTGYTTLTYTNTSGAEKDYIVNVSYESNTPDFVLAEDVIFNHVDGAIVKTVSAVDTVQYESIGETNILPALYDSLGVEINLTSTDQVLTDATNPVVVRIKEGTLPRNVAFFKKVTLKNNESVSLKFRCRSGEDSLLQKAQMFVNEID